MIAEVIPETKSNIEAFSYNIPEALLDRIVVGSIVSIPLSNRIIRGVVRSIGIDEPMGFKIKSIKELASDIILSKHYLKIAEWLSRYYLCSLGEAISIFLPPDLIRPRKEIPPDITDSLRPEIKLSQKQEEIYHILKNKLDTPKKPAIIFGVTGSGKTEIYLKLAKETINKNKHVVILVPEIVLTPQTVERFKDIFGESVALMHSNLSKSERLKCYNDFSTGKKPIIIGPRSALLVPSKKIGLIIIDEEQEDAYKQEQNPRYHAVDLAEQIAKELGALLVIGTATPRIESFYKAKSGIWDLFSLEKRHGDKALPKADLIDLREEIKRENYSPLSLKLQQKINQTLLRKKQILLFLNRRGSATFTSCRDCGYVVLCSKCSIPMIYHHNKSELSCHHCGNILIPPAKCPECESLKIKHFGTGIEKIEEEVKRLYPGKRIFRLDSSTITKKEDYLKFYNDFKKGKIDIAIGTQMIAKGLDIPDVELVGVISADTGLHLPHYKATEKTFQIITQVSGRSGRREHAGATVIQSYWPESEAIIAASKHDFKIFYDKEIINRKRFGYPPFRHLVRIVSEHIEEKKALNNLDKIKNTLQHSNLDLIGPGPCFYQKLHNKYRYQIILKLKKLPNDELLKIYKENPHLTFDVDPTNLL